MLFPSNSLYTSSDSSSSAGGSPSKAATLPSRIPNPLATPTDAQRQAYYASGAFGHPKGGSDQLPKGTCLLSYIWNGKEEEEFEWAGGDD